MRKKTWKPKKVVNGTNNVPVPKNVDEPSIDDLDIFYMDGDSDIPVLEAGEWPNLNEKLEYGCSLMSQDED